MLPEAVSDSPDTSLMVLDHRRGGDGSLRHHLELLGGSRRQFRDRRKQRPCCRSVGRTVQFDPTVGKLLNDIAGQNVRAIPNPSPNRAVASRSGLSARWA
jgi:hypothetical protein